MRSFPLALVLVLAVSSSAEAQESVGVRLGPAYTSVTHHRTTVGLLESQRTDTTETTSTWSPSLSVFGEVPVTGPLSLNVEAGLVRLTREAQRTTIYPYGPGVLRADYVSLSPTLVVSGGGSVRPYAFAGPRVDLILREQTMLHDGTPELRWVLSGGERQVTYGGVGGVGLAVPVSVGWLRDLHVDVRGTALDDGYRLRVRTVEARLGVGFAPGAPRRQQPRPPAGPTAGDPQGPNR